MADASQRNTLEGAALESESVALVRSAPHDARTTGNLYNSERNERFKIKFEIMNPPAARRPARAPARASRGKWQMRNGPGLPPRRPSPAASSDFSDGYL